MLLKCVKLPFIVLLLCLFSFSAVAQKATLKGKMISSSDNSPLPFASVTIVNGDETTGCSSDLDGNYEIQLDPGTYKVTYSFLGYKAYVKDISLAAGEERIENVALGNSAELLEQVVISTTKTEQKIGKETVSIAVIQSALIENTNSTAIDEVIEKIPGVNIIDGQANIRGGSGYSYGAGSRVLLLVDDLPFLAGDAGFPNWRDVPVENVSQIEVIKGAASALYGSSALNGVINVRTAYPTSDPVTNVSSFGTMYFAAPSLDTCSTGNCEAVPVPRDWWNDESNTTIGMPFDAGMQFAHRQKFGRFDLVLGANLYANNSFRQGEYDRKFRANANTRYRITDNLSVGVNLNFNRGASRSFFVWQDPWTGAHKPYENFTTPTKALRYNIDPFVTYFDKFGNRHKVMSRFYHVGNDNGNDQSNFSDLLYGEYQYQRSFDQLGGLSVVSGIVGQNTKVDAQLYGNGEYTQTNLGLYLQLDKGFFKRGDSDDNMLTLSAGVRYELNSTTSPDTLSVCPKDADGNYTRILNENTKTTESRPVFRFGANFQPAEFTFVRASWGQGYRYPTIAEKYITTSVSILEICPNPNLQSETGWSSEIGFKQGFKVSSWQGFLDASLFYTEYQEMMEFTFGGADFANQILGFQSVNIGNTQIFGTEFSLMGQGTLFGFPTAVLTGYTFLNPKFKEWDATPIVEGEEDMASAGQINAVLTTGDENFLKYRFKHTFKFDGQMTFFDKLDVGFSLQYNSFMKTIDQFFEKQKVEIAPGFFVDLDLFKLEEYRARYNKGSISSDLRMAYNFNKNLKISVLLKNITNNEITLRPALMEAPRNFTVRLDAKF